MNKARIKLAKAMGIDHEESGELFGNRWAFDPFVDANNDFVVLEWAREKKGIPRDVGTRYRDFMFELGVLQLKRGEAPSCLHEAYQIGDYARAACKVLGIKYNEN